MVIQWSFMVIQWSFNGHSWSFNGHSMVIQWSFNGHSMVTQWSFNGHSVVIQWSFGGHFALRVTAFLSLISLVSVVWFIYSLLVYFTSLFIVTNNRVIGEYGILSSNFDETPIFKINSVTYNKPIIGQIFNYGKVIIQSAATKGESGISFVGNPKVLRDMISELVEKHESNNNSKQHEISDVKTISSKNNILISDELIKLNELKEKGIISENEFIKAKEPVDLYLFIFVDVCASRLNQSK